MEALRAFSTPPEEEDLLLAAVRRFSDESIFEALCFATPRVLPMLEEILARVGPEYVDSYGIAQAIRIIRYRAGLPLPA